MRLIQVGTSLSLILGLHACVKKESKSNLNQIKIQIGEQAPALVISSEGQLLKSTDGSETVSWVKPSVNCNQYDENGTDLFLPDDFNPETYNGSAEAGCPVYGWTRPTGLSTSFPAWKAGTQAIFLEGSRSSYPLGYTLEPADNIAMNVSVCTLLPNASDQTDYKNCLNENKNFFAAETAAMSADEAKKAIGMAVLEALQVLTYNDKGLQQCYERSLLATDAIENQFSYPLDPSFSIFRALRQRSETMPISEDELAYLQEVIESPELKKTEGRYDPYTLRSLLALRLGYTYGQLDNKRVPEAFEPFGDLTTAYDLEAERQLKQIMKSSDTERLSAGADNIKIFADGALQSLLNTPGHEFFVAATGQVDQLGQQTYKLPSGTPLSQAKTRILADILYRAVLLAKASELKPLEALQKLKDDRALVEGCEDYAEYRPGLSSVRDQIVRSYLINTALSNKPTIATGTFKSLLIDSEKQLITTGLLPIALHRSPDCADNPQQFCPIQMQVAAASNPRYRGLKVRVKNPFNISNTLWEKPIQTIGSNAQTIDIISAADSADLVSKGFFKSKTILPVIEIEGVLKEPLTTSDLVYSSKLDRRPVACEDFRVGDERVRAIEHGTLRERCTAAGAFESVAAPSCENGYSRVGNQCAKVCDGVHKIGESWPVTFDGGSYVAQCLEVEGVSQVLVKSGSGTCNDKRYDFQESSRSCQLARCSNGSALGSDWYDFDPNLANGKRQYKCIAGDIVAQDQIRCDVEYLNRNQACLRSCDGFHVDGDPAFDYRDGQYVCKDGEMKLLSCNDNAPIVYGRCDSMSLKRRLAMGTLFTIHHVTDRATWNSSPENPIRVYAAVDANGELIRPTVSGEKILQGFPSESDDFLKKEGISAGSYLVVCNDNDWKGIQMHASEASSPFRHGSQRINWGKCSALPIVSLKNVSGSRRSYDHAYEIDNVPGQPPAQEIYFKLIKINPNGEAVP